jgi:hypothetical protein
LGATFCRSRRGIHAHAARGKPRVGRLSRAHS